MKVAPVYGVEPAIRLHGPPEAVAQPLIRQRRRLASVLSSLPAEQWAAPSRCEGWRVQDVAAHLAGADRFWVLSIEQGLAGTPTRYLDGFDPKATPAAMVDAVRDAAWNETLASLVEGTEEVCRVVGALDADDWSTLAETPVGHVTLSALAHHMLWDAWVHERDIMLPLGMRPEEHDDEVLAGLRYAAALGPALWLQSEPGRSGALVLDVVRPDARVVVQVGGGVQVTGGTPPDGALVVCGEAVEVLEAVSVRVPWSQPIPPDQQWLVDGLSRVFESSPPG